MILLIDNYDSFVHNLARYFRQLGQQTSVRRNDRLTLDEVSALAPSHIVISPGPCTPEKAGVSVPPVLEEAAKSGKPERFFDHPRINIGKFFVAG